jgi:hypothetical protein
MTARTTFETTVKSASQTQIATVAAAEMTRQETINASGCNVGYTTSAGNYGNLKAAVASANLAKAATLNAAEIAKQQTIMVARDTLRATGDVGAD